MDITTIKFEGKLRQGEEQLFRGALLHLIGDNTSLLLHNHVGNGLRYSYPLVQYKVLDGCAAVVGIADGADDVMRLPKHCQLLIGEQPREYQLTNINIQPYTPVVGNEPKMYAVTRYIPLNTSNMEEFDSLPALTDRVCLLENIINANILAFFKGIGYHCDDEIHTAISSIERKYDLYYKRVKFYAFDLKVITNATLPDGIGLGKSPSVGFGVVRRIAVPKIFKSKLK